MRIPDRSAANLQGDRLVSTAAYPASKLSREGLKDRPSVAPSLAAALTAFITLILASPAMAQSWVDQLRNVREDVCCTNNDGRRLDDPDWDTLGKVGGDLSGYRVHEAGQWHEVPAAAVVIMRNKDGIARLWWNLTTDDAGYVTGRSIRCFLPGATG